jgi:hypothetical protein
MTLKDADRNYNLEEADGPGTSLQSVSAKTMTGLQAIFTSA